MSRDVILKCLALCRRALLVSISVAYFLPWHVVTDTSWLQSVIVDGVLNQHGGALAHMRVCHGFAHSAQWGRIHYECPILLGLLIIAELISISAPRKRTIYLYTSAAIVAGVLSLLSLVDLFGPKVAHLLVNEGPPLFAQYVAEIAPLFVTAAYLVERALDERAQ